MTDQIFIDKKTYSYTIIVYSGTHTEYYLYPLVAQVGEVRNT